MKKELFSNEIKKENAFLVYVCLDNREDVDLYLEELKSLAEACNLTVKGSIVQNRKIPDGAYYIGEGKLEELENYVKNEDVDVVIFDNSLSGSKIKNLEMKLGVRVIDRTMLILDIFASRALSKEGALQVELAQLKYTLPRLAGLSGSNGRFGGGVGMRGPGETKLELNKRVIEKNILMKSKELNALKDRRELLRKNRTRGAIFSVALVGYTNSGKSTLLNSLTKSNVLAKNMLFATLDTTSKKMYLGDFKECVIVDTVGFVSRLPHDLVNAFHSTLEEAVIADLILHIVDVSDENYEKKMNVVNETLKDLGAKNEKIHIIYNKCDKVNLDELKERDENVKNGICISASNRINLEKLKDLIKSCM